MWISQTDLVNPKPFKNCISCISEQFQGYDQQDAQEFLAFLLDSLHEELNLRIEKPYVENPDSNTENVLELGLETYSNHLRREWSFIYFMFYGLLKSQLMCKDCGNKSTTFDIFTNVPLSLPEPNQIVLNVVLYRLPQDLKDIITGKGGQVLKRIESARSW